MKTCADCHVAKPFEDFSKDSRKKDGKDSYCRFCKAEKQRTVPREKQQQYQNAWRSKNRESVNQKSRERHATNPEFRRASTRRYRERYPERARESGIRQRQTRREWLAAIKAERGCARCGIADPRVLDFHHNEAESKELAVSQLVVRASWQAVLDEVAKCEVLCANCHRITHAEQAATLPESANSITTEAEEVLGVATT